MIIDAYRFGSAPVDPTALAIYNKFATGEWWTCDSATSPLVGAHASKNATKIGTGATSSVAGKVNNAVDVTPNAVFRATSLPFTPASGSTYALGIWVHPDSINNVTPLVLGQADNQTGALRAVQMFLINTGVFKVRAGDGIGSFTDADSAASSVATGGWYFLQAERGTNYVRCRVNGGSWVSVSITANQAPTTSQAITFGGDYNSTGSVHLNSYDGRLDELFCLQGVLTNTEWDYLYNAGAGISYAALKAAAGF